MLFFNFHHFLIDIQQFRIVPDFVQIFAIPLLRIFSIENKCRVFGIIHLMSQYQEPLHHLSDIIFLFYLSSRQAKIHYLKLFLIFFGVPHLLAFVFIYLHMLNKTGLGTGLNPVMALSPFFVSIR